MDGHPPLIGERFHQATKITPEDLTRPLPPRPPAPSRFKSYPGPKIVLPPPKAAGLPFEQALRRRRSVRAFRPEPLRLREMSQLLFAAQGVTAAQGDRLLRTAPSAGGSYPFEVHVAALRVRVLTPGVYHYDPRDHSLTLHQRGCVGKRLARLALDQAHLAQAGAVFVLAAVVDRVRAKYGERGWRYAYMEAGHISQNLYLQATSLGLGSVVVGAFLDDLVHAALGLEPDEVVLYLHAVGRVAAP